MSMIIEQLPLPVPVPGLRHTLSTRGGGVSEGAFASLNLGYHVGDDPARVCKNRRRLARAAGYDAGALVCAQQVHGVALAWVGADARGRGAANWDDALPAIDGLLTRESRLPVAILVADCAPVLIADPRRRVLAVVHAGWRGALGGIASAAVRRMITDAGTDPAQLVVGIGPALCPACLEVGEEVATAVRDAGKSAALCDGEARPHLELAALIGLDLATVGVTAAQIGRHQDCTRCRPERYFSHRGQQGNAGRLACVAWWE